MKTMGMGPDSAESDIPVKSVLPAVVLKEEKEIPLLKAIIFSTVAHPLVVGLLWLLVKGIILLLLLLGISLSMFDRPEPKVRDLEFVIINKPEQNPINKNTKYRSDRNSRAGGKHDKKRKVSEPEPAAARATPQKKATPAPKPVKPQPKATKPTAKPRPTPPRPAPKKVAPQQITPPPNTFRVPVPMTKVPKTVAPAGGPVTSAPLGTSSPTQSPSPLMATRPSTPGRSKYTSGFSAGGGNPGNPGMGNPNGAPGIDAIKEPDFGPWMRELQSRIKRNWSPPRGNESKRVVLMFTVGRDGQLLNIKTIKSSGVEVADRAAHAAIELTAPFKPLPPEYRESSIDIQFTFDYNVFGVGGY